MWLGSAKSGKPKSHQKETKTPLPDFKGLEVEESELSFEAEAAKDESYLIPIAERNVRQRLSSGRFSFEAIKNNGQHYLFRPLARWDFTSIDGMQTFLSTSLALQHPLEWGIIDRFLSGEVTANRSSSRNQHPRLNYSKLSTGSNSAKSNLSPSYRSGFRERNAIRSGRDSAKAIFSEKYSRWFELQLLYSAIDSLLPELERLRQHRHEYVTFTEGSLMNYLYDYFEYLPLPEFVPRKIELFFDVDSQILIVNSYLPEMAKVPFVKSTKKLKSSGELRQIPIPKSQRPSLYDNFLYQLVLRTLNELFTADDQKRIHSIALNGLVEQRNPSTGNPEQICVLSIFVPRAVFLALDLKHVDPKECFKALKGVASAKLSACIAIRPVIEFDKSDSRIIEGYNVADKLDGSVNLASMDWQDFENLIRELFEKIVGGRGGEVKITQASRDGGVDALLFDPDPVFGGKTCIQAKRYTNVVGVACVRDLYGTIINEGANSGILVTTSSFGPDAYNFAKDKNIKLLNGSELLYLLQQNGWQAKIDLREAKELAREEAGKIF